MPEPSRLPTSVHEALRFAKRELGPASLELLSKPAAQALLLSRVRDGLDVADAVLAEVHRNMGKERALANEFLAYFLADLYRLGRPMISPGLHRFLDTGDLAQSVLGDIWPQIGSLEFRTRGEFLSLLAKRLRWKSSDKARKAERSGDESDHDTTTPLDAAIAGSPLAQASNKDEHERLILILMRLRDRDRMLLSSYLQGKPIEEVMATLDIGYEAARKAQRRAIERARDLLRERLAEDEHGRA